MNDREARASVNLRRIINMIRSLNSAITGLRSQQTALDIIGNNIANSSTPGFRYSRATFQDLFYETLSQGSATVDPSQVGYGTKVGSIDRTMDRVGATQTDRAEDLYIDGDGYFAVNTSEDNTGSNYYTRVGNLHVSTDGYVLDSNGNYVLDNTTASGAYAGVPICLVGDTLNGSALAAADLKNLSITFNNDGSISGSLNNGTVGQLTKSGKAVTIGVVSFTNPDGLLDVGNSCFSKSMSSGDPAEVNMTSSSTFIRSGELDMSNVDLAKEFTNMISTERGYQSDARVITVSDDILQELVNLKRS